MIDIMSVKSIPLNWGVQGLIYSSHQDNISMQGIPPYTPPKLGNARVYIPIFLIFAPNIDCGYSLELPRRGGSNMYPQSMF